MTQRYDFVPFAVARKTDEGYILDSPIVGRTGIQLYNNNDGSIRRELRLPEEVFKPDSLASFRGKPITVDHPAAGRVGADNASGLTVGVMLSEGKQDGETVRSDIVLHSPAAIGERRQLSLGYDVRVDATPGIHPTYGPYDAIQRDIKINHLSVVAQGRAGVARLNVDGNESLETLPTPGATQMPKLTLDNGLAYEAPAEVIADHERLRQTCVTQKAAIDAFPAKLGGVEAERDALKAKVDAFPEQLKKAKSDAATELAARSKLEASAGVFKVKVDANMTDRAIMEAVIKTVRKDFDPTGKSDEYVRASYEIACESNKDHADAMAHQRQAANGGGAGGAGAGGGTNNNDGGSATMNAYDRHMAQLHDGYASMTQPERERWDAAHK